MLGTQLSISTEFMYFHSSNIGADGTIYVINYFVLLKSNSNNLLRYGNIQCLQHKTNVCCYMFNTYIIEILHLMSYKYVISYEFIITYISGCIRIFVWSVHVAQLISAWQQPKVLTPVLSFLKNNAEYDISNILIIYG